MTNIVNKHNKQKRNRAVLTENQECIVNPVYW